MQTLNNKQMVSQLTLQKNDGLSKTREVRLGLVMYGGVSLAIYINGVAREFFRAVQGQGIYRLIKALIDADIVIDIISGTSAGGVNGIMLAYALCNQKDFGSTAQLWRNHGGIKDLLRSPYTDKTPTSVLNSEGYYQPHLQEAFTKMKDYQTTPHDAPSPIKELDLFITGTDVDGQLYTQFDDGGHPIDIKDHRSVFLIKHRKGRKEPFTHAASKADNIIEALAKLARITSCFPAAFTPVHVAETKPGEDSADALLQQWGRLGKESVFIDGGVLDNKPFTYTTKAIYSRVAERDVDRKMFFIEPDPEAFTKPSKATKPNAVQAVLAALIGIPGYESIADDLKLLSERNSKLTQYNRLVHRIENKPPEEPVSHSEKYALYRCSRLVSISDRVVEGIFKRNGQPIQIKDANQRRKAKELIQVFDQIITDGDPRDTDQLFEDFDIYYCLRKTFRLIYLMHELLYSKDQQSSNPVENPETYLMLLSTLNRQVKLYEVLQSAMERLINEVSYPWQGDTEQELWTKIQRSLLVLLQIQDFDGEDSFSGKQMPLLPGQFDPGKPWFPQQALTDINKKLNKRIEAIQKAFEDKSFDQRFKPQRPSILRHVARLEQQIIQHFLPEPDDPVLQAYTNFDALDSVLFPIELVGGLHEKDIIDTVRISPKDAQRGFSNNNLTSKVAGDAVYHFGGFFKRSWRSNDILWGRLDGLCQLVETLLSRKRIEKMVASVNGRQKLRQQFFSGNSGSDASTQFQESLEPAKLFPNAGNPTQETISRWLQDLLSDDSNARQKALDPLRFDKMVTLLIEAAQLEVLFSDVPYVIKDAIDEQHEWNRYQVVKKQVTNKTAKNKKVPAKPEKPDDSVDKEVIDDAMPAWVFTSLSQYLDPLGSNLSSDERAAAFMAHLKSSEGNAESPLKTSMGNYFMNRYKVGTEMLLRDIPNSFLLEIVATAMLVVHNVLLCLFSSDTQRRIKSSALYRFGLYFPLRAFHSLTMLVRKSPKAGLAVLVGANVVSLCALIAGIIGWDRIWYAEHTFSLGWFAAFILIPFLVISATIYFLARMTK